MKKPTPPTRSLVPPSPRPPAPAPAVGQSVAPAAAQPAVPQHKRLDEEAFASAGRGDTSTGVFVPGQQPVEPEEQRDLSLPHHTIPAKWTQAVIMSPEGKGTYTPYMFRLSKNQRDRIERLIQAGGYTSKQAFCESAIERALRIAEHELGLISV